MKKKSKGEFVRYSFRAWMKKYRPDGVGRMGVTTETSHWETTFTEVICDFCNDEIAPTLDVGGETVDNIVIASDGYALCEDCGEKVLTREAA